MKQATVTLRVGRISMAWDWIDQSYENRTAPYRPMGTPQVAIVSRRVTLTLGGPPLTAPEWTFIDALYGQEVEVDVRIPTDETEHRIVYEGYLKRTSGTNIEIEMKS